MLLRPTPIDYVTTTDAPPRGRRPAWYVYTRKVHSILLVLAALVALVIPARALDAGEFMGMLRSTVASPFDFSEHPVLNVAHCVFASPLLLYATLVINAALIAAAWRWSGGRPYHTALRAYVFLQVALVALWSAATLTLILATTGGKAAPVFGDWRDVKFTYSDLGVGLLVWLCASIPVLFALADRPPRPIATDAGV